VSSVGVVVCGTKGNSDVLKLSPFKSPNDMQSSEPSLVFNASAVDEFRVNYVCVF